MTTRGEVMREEYSRAQSKLRRSVSGCLIALLAFAWLSIGSPANAQSTGGRIRGTVSDPSGSAVVGARVTLTNEATNISRDSQTNDNGEYLFLEVPVGNYTIEV